MSQSCLSGEQIPCYLGALSLKKILKTFLDILQLFDSKLRLELEVLYICMKASERRRGATRPVQQPILPVSLQHKKVFCATCCLTLLPFFSWSYYRPQRVGHGRQIRRVEGSFQLREATARQLAA